MSGNGCLAWINRAGIGVFLSLFSVIQVHAALDSATHAKIQSSVFEVIVPKPVKDSLTYEKPLPFELLPSKERTDKYITLGNAFAIGDGRYVSSAHILKIGQRTQFDLPVLRDSNSNIHQIDEIYKYSLAEDFVVFTLKDNSKSDGLPVGKTPAANASIYAIDTAPGGGGVTRGGKFTSETPESQNGRWSWLRFSGPASSVNDGGPLLDEHGAVVGIVIGKAANEKLNYALPIDVALAAPDGAAVIDTRMTYRIALFDATETGTFKDQIALPKPFSELSDTVATKIESFHKQQFDGLLAHNAGTLFPNGPGSAQLLQTGRITRSTLLNLIKRDNDGNWKLTIPGNLTEMTLANKTKATTGLFEDGKTTLIDLERPDNIPAEVFYADSKRYGDLLLEAVPINRTVGPMAIRITSVGKAEREATFVDHYQRRWMLWVWPLEFSDEKLISLVLPLPDGYAAIVRQVPTAEAEATITELQAIADFTNVIYKGSFMEWEEFLTQSALVPLVFSTLNLTIDYDHRFEYRSNRMSLMFTPEFQKITRDGGMSVRFGYFLDGGKTVWDVEHINVSGDSHSIQQCDIARRTEPSEDMADVYKNDWIEVSNGLFPYAELPYEAGKRTWIRGVYPSTAPAGTEPKILYTTMCMDDGSQDETRMKTKLHMLMDGMKVYER